MTNTKGVLQLVGIIILAILYVGLMFTVLLTQSGEGRYYDCTWSEISPDIPPKVKEECRKQRSGRI